MKNNLNFSFKFGIFSAVVAAFIALAPETSAGILDSIKGLFSGSENKVEQSDPAPRQGTDLLQPALQSIPSSDPEQGDAVVIVENKAAPVVHDAAPEAAKESVSAVAPSEATPASGAVALAVTKDVPATDDLDEADDA